MFSLTGYAVTARQLSLCILVNLFQRSEEEGVRVLLSVTL